MWALNEFVAVIAAILGSSGVASILAGGTQFRRTHRLQSQLKELDAAKQLVPPGSIESSALEASVATVALELAAHILIRGDARRLVLMGCVSTSLIGALLAVSGTMPSTTAGAWFVFFPFPSPEGANVPLVMLGTLIVLAGYVALFIYVYLRISARGRSRLVSKLIKDHAIDAAEVLQISRQMTSSHRDTSGPMPVSPSLTASEPAAASVSRR